METWQRSMHLEVTAPPTSIKTGQGKYAQWEACLFQSAVKVKKKKKSLPWSSVKRHIFTWVKCFNLTCRTTVETVSTGLPNILWGHYLGNIWVHNLELHLRKQSTKRKYLQTRHSSLSMHPTSLKWSLAQSCPTLCDPMDCSLQGSSVHGLFQARVLEWVAMPSSRWSSQPRDQTWVSCNAGRFFTTEPPGKPYKVRIPWNS